jgi:hypothetical protein
VVEQIEVRIEVGDQLIVGHRVNGERFRIVLLLLLWLERCSWLGLRRFIVLVPWCR